MTETVLVLDFGGQYKELIASAVRGLSVYSEIRCGDLPLAEIRRINPIGIILTGGPDSVYKPDSPKCDEGLFRLGIPILGICYGMQLLCHMLGGEVSEGDSGEYGKVKVSAAADSKILDKKDFFALMSHRDIVTRLPSGFTATATTPSCIAACENSSMGLFGLQFHPETKHTQSGQEIIRRFLFEVCGARGGYKLDSYIKTQIKQIRERTAGKKVLLALSGGVDSSVCAALLSKAVPNQLICIFVDHGFMRKNEGDEIERVFQRQNLRFIRINAAERFFSKIRGVQDAETKRKLIGEEFVRVFEEEAKKLGNIPFLAQGTIYTDIVESGDKTGATIKSHHNVGGLPENLDFESIIEPLSGLFKNEVRIIGKKLGLPLSIVNRQPFPGTGLAIRIMGDVTEEKVETLKSVDAIVRDEIGLLSRRPSQYFAVLTDTRTVGVKGDSRTYDRVVAIRAVTTDDFMTCEYTTLPHKVLHKISSRITSEINSVSRVVYDITSKPPATVEWE